MSRLPRQVCASCGRPLPKDKAKKAPPSFVSDTPAPGPAPGSPADLARQVRDRIERSLAAGNTASMDLGVSENKPAPVPGEEKQGRLL